MNYGGKGIKQKKRLLNSATTKLGTKLGIFFIKLALVAAIAVVVSGSCLVLGSFQGIIENAPDIASVNVSPEGFATKIYDSDENEIQTLSSAGANRTYVTIDQIPKDLQHAFIAIEDERFYEHNGIDMRGILRAASITLSSGEMSQGASTITQQLARNIFLTQEVTWQRKIEEIFIAWGLEKKYSKEQILEFYLNNIYFGNGYYGVEAAAKGYFNKSVSQLTLSEQAFIAAIPNNPSKYNPLTGFDKTLKRRDLILQQMYEADYISYVDYYMAKGENIVLNQPEQEKEDNSVVTYVRHCATESLMKSTGFSFRDNFSSKEDEESYDSLYDTYYTRCQQMLLSGGYTVYTSFDMDLQNKLQQAVDDNLAGYCWPEAAGTAACSTARSWTSILKLCAPVRPSF